MSQGHNSIQGQRFPKRFALFCCNCIFVHSSHFLRSPQFHEKASSTPIGCSKRERCLFAEASFGLQAEPGFLSGPNQKTKLTYTNPSSRHHDSDMKFMPVRNAFCPSRFLTAFEGSSQKTTLQEEKRQDSLDMLIIRGASPPPPETLYLAWVMHRNISSESDA